MKYVLDAGELELVLADAVDERVHLSAGERQGRGVQPAVPDEGIGTFAHEADLIEPDGVVDRHRVTTELDALLAPEAHQYIPPAFRREVHDWAVFTLGVPNLDDILGRSTHTDTLAVVTTAHGDDVVVTNVDVTCH
jgi:hypothetical protein